MLPHPCWILQKYTIFGGSDTHPSTFLKSSSKIVFGSNQSFEPCNGIPSVPSVSKCEIWTRRVVIFKFRGVPWIWGPKLEIDVILCLEFTLVNIRSSNAQIEFSAIPSNLGDDFRPMWGLGWIFKGFKLSLVFLGVMLIYCNFHEFHVKKTLDLCFDGSIKFGTASLVG